MGRIQLLDCTLRDGAYIVESMFGDPAIRGIIGKLQDAGTDIIECGWLKNNEHKPNSSFYHVPKDMEQYLSPKNSNTTYTVMIDWDRYDLDFLPCFDGKSLDAVRVVFPHGKHREGIEVGRKIREKGYKVFFQAANTLAYSDEDLLNLASAMNRFNPVSISVVDTFGAMYEEDLERIVNILDANLHPEIKLGFHSHNNQQLSFALTIHFIKLMKDRKRDIIVDASLCGMGRGAGNTTTELLVSYLNKKCGAHYDMDAVMDAIDIYMSYFQENYQWGYSTPYFIAGMYCCHVNNIAYLLKNHRTSAKDMRNVIESMDPLDRRKYDYDLLEKKYLGIVSRNVDDEEARKTLRSAMIGKNVLLLAPGKSLITEREKIGAFIKENKPLVIGVNAIIADYDYDCLFFANSARYEYAKQASEDAFKKAKRILVSSIKPAGDENELIVSYDNVVKHGWKYFDNAMICCLRMMDWLGIEKVWVAGFDGFMTHYNESYADPALPTLNPDGKWDELNEEVLEMFRDFRQNAKNCKNIVFVTDSFFNR